MPTVGEIIVDSLVAHGIDRVFCVPGESYLALLDALHGRADIDTVVCRHEAGAGFMALADARLTGRPGVALVSRGPGASNAAIAVHTAQQDGVPFILLDRAGGGARRAPRLLPGDRLRPHVRPDRQMDGRGRPIRTAWRRRCCARSRSPRTGLPGPVVIVAARGRARRRHRRRSRPAAGAGHGPRPLAADVRALRAMAVRGGDGRSLIAGGGLERPGGRAGAARASPRRWHLPARRFLPPPGPLPQRPSRSMPATWGCRTRPAQMALLRSRSAAGPRRPAQRHHHPGLHLSPPGAARDAARARPCGPDRDRHRTSRPTWRSPATRGR